ncbi:MAG: DNA-processing protein DprA [Hyphomicrobiales bacterium]
MTDSAGGTGLRLTDEQKLDWIRLIRSESIGPRTFQTLLNRFGGARAVLEALPELLRAQNRTIKICSQADAEREFETAQRYGVTFIALGEPEYPRLLRQVPAPPPLIAVRGNFRILQQGGIAIVGSRNASATGLRLAEIFSHGFGKANLPVISGLARGIDAHAHRAALQTGTIAVLAGGHDKVYPAEHADLLDSILETGAAVSEMPMGWEPRGRDFPRRNRIISGLSDAVLVVEAAFQSGSLITARFAGEQGRDVFAVPGSPLDPRAEGTNALIRDGAVLVTQPEQIVAALEASRGQIEWPPRAEEEQRAAGEDPLWDELELDLEPTPSLLLKEPSPAERVTLHPPDDCLESPESSAKGTHDTLISLMGPSPIGVDDLIRLSRLSPRVVQMVLLDLELGGRIERHGGRLVSLVLPPAREINEGR